MLLLDTMLPYQYCYRYCHYYCVITSWITVTNPPPSYEGGASSLWGYLTLSTLPAGLIVTKLAENICDGLCNHVPNCQDCWESGLLKKQPKSPQLLGVWVSGYGSWPRPMAFLIPLHSAPQPMGDQQHFLPHKTITPCSQVKKKTLSPQQWNVIQAVRAWNVIHHCLPYSQFQPLRSPFPTTFPSSPAMRLHNTIYWL